MINQNKTFSVRIKQQTEKRISWGCGKDSSRFFHYGNTPIQIY